MGEIVEKVVITADGSKAEQEFRKVGDAAKKAFDQAAKAADGLGKEISEDEKILAKYQQSLKQHADALRQIEQGNTRIAEEQEKVRKGWETFAKGVAAGSVALAIYEVKRAFEAVVDMLAASIKPLSDVNGEWSKLDKTLGSIKDTFEDPEFQKLNVFEKILATGYYAIDTSAAEAKANVDKIEKLARERDLNNRALMRMVEEETGAAGTVNLMLGKPPIGTGGRGRGGTGKGDDKPAGPERYIAAPDAPNYDIPFDQGAAMEAQQRYAEAAAEIEQTKADRIREINESMHADLAAAREEDLRIHQAQMQEYASMISSAVGVASGAVMQLFDDLVNGSEDAGLKFAQRMLVGIGQTLFSKGLADQAAAVASGLIYGNWSGMGAAGAEMAIGATLMGGGSIIGAQISKNEDARKEKDSAASGSRSFSGGGTGGIRRSSGGESTNITINLQGPVYDGAAAGVAIMQKIAEAKKQGMLR